MLISFLIKLSNIMGDKYKQEIGLKPTDFVIDDPNSVDLFVNALSPFKMNHFPSSYIIVSGLMSWITVDSRW